MLTLSDGYAMDDGTTPPAPRTNLATLITRFTQAVRNPVTVSPTYPPRGSPVVVGPTGPVAPPGPTAPLPPDPPVQITPIPTGVPIGPTPDVPGAGPTATVTMAPGTGSEWDVFNPATFTWWKPVLIATGVALFGGALIAIFTRKHG